MILNVSPNISDIKFTAKYFGLNMDQEAIIDCSALINLNRPDFFSICEIENFEQINDKCVLEYIEEIGKISLAPYRRDKLLRDVKINEHSIFWLTMLAVKHPQQSLGKIIYLVDKILPLIKTRLSGKIYICVPAGCGHYQNLIRNIFKKHGIKDINLVKQSNIGLWNFISSSKSLLFFYLKCLVLFLFNERNRFEEIPRNYFITHSYKTVDAGYSDFFLSPLRDFTDSVSSGKYWPIFFSFKSLKKSITGLSQRYRSALPSFIQLTKQFLSGLHCILFFKYKVRNNNLLFFEDDCLLNYEIKLAVIKNMHNIFYGVWMKNYFSKVTVNANVIYQDEFYESGRIISKSLESCNGITTAGLQHGLFDLHHTVYGISDTELSEKYNNPVPGPDIFIVWGEYFKNYFLSNNNFDPGRIKVLGNPRYFNQAEPNSEYNQKIKKILWCTDTPEFTANDILYLEDTVLNNSSFEITLRSHPVYNFLEQYKTELKLFERFPLLRISVNTSIMDDISDHDLVIVNCYSTAFMDTYLSGKPCLRLYPYRSSPNYLKFFRNKLIYNIFSKDNIMPAMQTIENSQQRSNKQDESERIMNINIPEWEQFLVGRGHRSNKINSCEVVSA